MQLTARSIVAGTALAVLWPALPAAAGESSGDGRQPEEFRASGTAVDGGDSLFSAPGLGAGTYTDETEAGGESSFYRVRRTANDSILRVGATSITGEWLRVEVLDGRGTECGEVSEETVGLVVGHAQDVHDDDCGNTDEVVVKVSAQDDTAGRLPFELHVAEEAAVTTRGGLPTPSEDVEWEEMKPSDDAEQKQGALSFADAPELEAGRSYTGTLVAGERRVYKVPADWGQRVQAQVDVAPQEEALAPGGISVALVGADRRPLNVDLGGSHEDSGSVQDDAETVLQASSRPIAWLNREDAGPTLPGGQYVVVAADEYGATNQEVPFTLTVDVLGDPEGEPEHDPESQPSEERDQVVRHDSGDGGEAAAARGGGQGGLVPGDPLLWAGGAVGVLLLGAGALALLLNRRTGRS
ncbi:hypothetical protein [Kytococcus sp. Marseille-QA3725]